MTTKSERSVWHETERGWKKDGKIISFESMSNKELKKLKKFLQYRETQLLNKAWVMADKIKELSEEALSRGLMIKDLNHAYSKSNNSESQGR